MKKYGLFLAILSITQSPQLQAWPRTEYKNLTYTCARAEETATGKPQSAFATLRISEDLNSIQLSKLTYPRGSVTQELSYTSCLIALIRNLLPGEKAEQLTHCYKSEPTPYGGVVYQTIISKELRNLEDEGALVTTFDQSQWENEAGYPGLKYRCKLNR